MCNIQMGFKTAREA